MINYLPQDIVEQIYCFLVHNSTDAFHLSHMILKECFLHSMSKAPQTSEQYIKIGLHKLTYNLHFVKLVLLLELKLPF